MLKADLYRTAKYAAELYKMVDKFDQDEVEVDFPYWWQAKIIKSKDMLIAAKHYLDFEMVESQIDAMVDAASDEGVDSELSNALNEDESKVSQHLIDSFIDGVKRQKEYGEYWNLYATEGEGLEFLLDAAEITIQSTDSDDTTREELVDAAQLYALGKGIKS